MFLPEAVEEVHSRELASLLFAVGCRSARLLKIVDQLPHHSVERFSRFVVEILLEGVVLGPEDLSLLTLLLALFRKFLFTKFVPPIRRSAARILCSLEIVDEVRLWAAFEEARAIA